MGRFDPELHVALTMACGDRAALERIVAGAGGPGITPAAVAQAHIALGNLEAARKLYEGDPPNARRETDYILNDDWAWRLPHAINLAHLRLAAGDERGRRDLDQVLADVARVTAQGIVSSDISYRAASALHLLGRRDEARQQLAQARRQGWRHDWWQRIDWNAPDRT